MSIEPIIIFFFFFYLRKILRTSAPNAEWERNLTLSMFGVGVLFIIEKFLHADAVMMWVWHLALLSILAIIYFNPAFSASRTLMFAVFPFIVLSLFNDIIKEIFPSFFDQVHDYLEVGAVFTVIWMVVMLIVSKKQRRALEKERLKTLAEEELNLRLEQQKLELEGIVAKRTSELVQQKEELEQALVHLKSMQSQLIQQEKLASLGELTAGIAHEIQNPLNFVNNFSEVNSELIDEMQNELNAGNMEEAIALANDIKENEQKIVFHGRRADTIVKGMLQHSRTSSGTKEPTDINELADEYLRLSYHGLRAKDKSFNATMQTNFDESIGNIDIIPQDIGRVLLNLFTNAFYSVSEKKKEAGEAFEPTVWVTTKKIGNMVRIIVRDNGLGVPQSVMDKIFQPFFTTKPTGEGTGLGLSLSYDIVTKGHGGELNVYSKNGDGAEFIILLPL